MQSLFLFTGQRYLPNLETSELGNPSTVHPDLLSVGEVLLPFGTIRVYRGNVTVDDTFLNRAYIFNRYKYMFTVLNGKTSLLESQDYLSENEEEVSLDFLTSIVTSLPIPPTRELREEFEKGNTLANILI